MEEKYKFENGKYYRKSLKGDWFEVLIDPKTLHFTWILPDGKKVHDPTFKVPLAIKKTNQGYMVPTGIGSFNYYSTIEEAGKAFEKAETDGAFSDSSENIANDLVFDVLTGRGLVKGTGSLIRNIPEIGKSLFRGARRLFSRPKTVSKIAGKQAVKAIPGVVGGAAGMYGVDEASEALTGKTWGLNIAEDLTQHYGFEVPVLIGDFTNPGAFIGGIAGNYIGSKFPAAIESRLSNSFISDSRDDILARLELGLPLSNSQLGTAYGLAGGGIRQLPRELAPTYGNKYYPYEVSHGDEVPGFLKLIEQQSNGKAPISQTTGMTSYAMPKPEYLLTPSLRPAIFNGKKTTFRRIDPKNVNVGDLAYSLSFNLPGWNRNAYKGILKNTGRFDYDYEEHARALMYDVKAQLYKKLGGNMTSEEFTDALYDLSKKDFQQALKKAHGGMYVRDIPLTFDVNNLTTEDLNKLITLLTLYKYGGKFENKSSKNYRES